MEGSINKIESLVNLYQNLIQQDNGVNVTALKNKLNNEFNSNGGKNQYVTERVENVQDLVWKTMQVLGELYTWMSLQVPVIEDGNNFGVEVQGYVIKKIFEARKELKGFFDGFKDYHSQRLTAMKEVCSKVTSSKKKVESEKEANVTGGEKPGSSTTKTVDSDVSVTEVSERPMEDAMESVLAIDMHWYFHSMMVATQAVEILRIILDTADKNKAKIVKPKGSRPMY